MIYFDFEYNDTQVILCVAQKNSEEATSFDLRNGREVSLLKEYMVQNKDEIFVSYALSAEITSLLRCGIPVDNVKCVDLMAECRMITMSHDKYFAMDGSMLTQLRVILGLDITEDKTQKEAMRDLILKQNQWTGAEWDDITLYCYNDIVHLRDLLEKVMLIHKEENHPLTLENLLERGKFVRACAEMDYASEGFPVYGDNIDKIYGNKEAIKTAIIKNLPYYWQVCYEKKKGGGWTLKKDRVTALAKERGWLDAWKKTDSGLISLEADYLEVYSLTHEEIRPLYRAIKSLVTLNSADLREQNKNGYIGTQTFAFAAKTGRNGLKPKRGYLLNLPKWMRRMVQPHPGKALIGADWSQQEIAVAAALSGDQQLIAAYATGDVYLALGKMSGHIPESGTKATHKNQRDLFKALQLGLNYGKGLKSLGLEFYNIMKEDGVSLIDAQIKAKEIYSWHKLHFSTYWDWINKKVNTARMSGWIETGDGWVEWVSRKTLTTQLLNFPSQSTGAEMMRKATMMFYQLWKEGKIVPVLCSQHDAFYFNCDEESAVVYSEKIERVMLDASKDLIGISVKVDLKIYTVDHAYIPDGWLETHENLWNSATK